MGDIVKRYRQILGNQQNTNFQKHIYNIIKEKREIHQLSLEQRDEYFTNKAHYYIFRLSFITHNINLGRI